MKEGLQVRKFKEAILGITVIFFSLVSFSILFYTLKGFVDAGDNIFKALNSTSVDAIRFWDIVIILWAILVTSGIVFLLQFFKSIFDATAKKMCDDAAKDCVELFEKWINK